MKRKQNNEVNKKKLLETLKVKKAINLENIKLDNSSKCDRNKVLNELVGARNFDFNNFSLLTINSKLF